MYLEKIIASIDGDTRRKAEKFLKSKSFVSLKYFRDGYEAIIINKNKLLLPQIVFTRSYKISEYECQCRQWDSENFCVHLAAMILGIEKMLETGCGNYHTAT
jgi:hypothetical protein